MLLADAVIAFTHVVDAYYRLVAAFAADDFLATDAPPMPSRRFFFFFFFFLRRFLLFLPLISFSPIFCFVDILFHAAACRADAATSCRDDNADYFFCCFDTR